MTRNLLISGGGVLVGLLIAVVLNLWMVTQFAVALLSLAYLFGAVLLLGQTAVFAPALRASRVSPVEATRSA